MPVGGLQSPPSSIGGWNLDVQQTYDPVGQTLYGGDGSRRSAQGQNFDVIRLRHRPAAQRREGERGADAPEGFARTPDGATIIADTGANVIRRVDADGTRARRASPRPADAELDDPADVALGADGARLRRRPRQQPHPQDRGRRDHDGRGHRRRGLHGRRRAGARAPRFDAPSDVAVAPDGTLYVIDSRNHALRKIALDGTIGTVLGTGAPGALRNPRDVAVRADGAVFVADSGNQRVLRITPDGVVSTVAGDGVAGYRGDGGPATAASLDLPSAVAPRADGGFFIADAGNAVIRSVASDGTITTVAGSPRATGAGGDNGAAPRAHLNFPQAIARRQRRDLHAARHRQRQPAHGRARAARAGDRRVRDPVRRRRAALRLLAGRPPRAHARRAHRRDAADVRLRRAPGRLISVTNDKGKVATIARDTAGLPTKITGYYGQRDGALDRRQRLPVEDRAAGRRRAADDLRRGRADEDAHRPASTASTASATTPPGGSPATRTPTTTRRRSPATCPARRSTVTLTTPEGHKTTYVNETLPTGEHRRTVTDPMGGKTVSVVGQDGTASVTLPSGEVDTYTLGPDPRFGMAAPLIAVATVDDAGRARRGRRPRRAPSSSRDPGDPLSLKRMVDSTTVNGHTIHDRPTTPPRTR